jgi:hypothetical protein
MFFEGSPVKSFGVSFENYFITTNKIISGFKFYPGKFSLLSRETIADAEAY